MADSHDDAIMLMQEQEQKIQKGELDSVLDMVERQFLFMRTIAPESLQKREEILSKVCNDPRFADVRYVLCATRDNMLIVHKYTEEAHEQLTRLLPALCNLMHDVNNLNEETTKPPVVDIGRALHALGGINTMCAVYCAAVLLLSDQVAYNDDGSTKAETALSMAWSGVGEWP